MRGTLLALLLMAAAFSGCITEMTEGDSSSGAGTGSGQEVAEGEVIGEDDQGNEITEGQPLGEWTWSEDGDAGVQGYDSQCDSVQGSQNNVGVIGGKGRHIMSVPLSNTEGIGWKMDSVTFTVAQDVRGTVDLELFVFGTDGKLAGRSQEPGPDGAEDANTFTLADMPAGSYRLEVVNCGGVATQYTISVTADMVATATPGGGGCILESTSNGYRATRVETYQKDLTGNEGTADVSTGAGGINVRAVSGSTYQLVATLTARADTEDDACRRLAEMYIEYRVENGDPVVMNIHGRSGDGGTWNKKQIDLDIQVPANIDWSSFEADVAAGNIVLDGIQGGDVSLDVAAGNIDVDNVDADFLNIDASAGNILVDTTRAGDVHLDASAGNIIASFEASVQSGEWNFDVSAGNIDVTVEETSRIGYDVDARSSAGTVSFDFEDVETTRTDCQYASCHKEGRTNGYASRSIQITMDLDVSAGNIAAGS